MLRSKRYCGLKIERNGFLQVTWKNPNSGKILIRNFRSPVPPFFHVTNVKTVKNAKHDELVWTLSYQWKNPLYLFLYLYQG